MRSPSTVAVELAQGAGGAWKLAASARGLVKVYGTGDTAVRALDGVDVDFARGELTAIMGPSGSGKSTLMHCLAGLDPAPRGSVVVDGEDVGSMSERQLTPLRRPGSGSSSRRTTWSPR